MSDTWTPTLVHPKTPVAKHAEVTKILATTSPEQLTVLEKQYKSLTLVGNKGTNVNNTASVFVGFNSTNQPFEITPGQAFSLAADHDGWPLQMNKIWVRGAVGDGVVGAYYTDLDN